MMLVGLPLSTSGCAYSLSSCNDFSGTAKYDECLAAQGHQEKQYELGLVAYRSGNMDDAIKWLKKAAEPRDNRTPIFIPKGNGDVRIQMQETGLSTPGHYGAQQLLDKIYEEGMI